tara:strand:+ start:802 stop:1329 length:528 start_codon:yes stop_codon:yes gene_type:complete
VTLFANGLGGVQNMTWIDPSVFAALIAASAALGAAVFAFAAAVINARVARKNSVLQALIAQRTKRAEFRQSWINQLRDCFSEIQGGLIVSEDVEMLRQITRNSHKILLLMNRDDPDYERMRHALSGILEYRNQVEDVAATAARLEMVEVCQDILKREWEVTKNEIRLLEKDAQDI